MSDDKNRLGDETSPYLRQHADNPVHWFPWGQEALDRARDQDKPIFLSVGYSACHWCHVMERESFENDEVATVLNDHFVSIKVDREERPELDAIYMDAVQLMSGQGGWPMSVWLTPDLEPFYAGTYFPPQSKWGRAGFIDVLKEVHRVWSEERDRVMSIAEEMTQRLEAMSDPGGSAKRLRREPIRAAADELSRRFDPKNGGFGEAPKFPASAQCRLLLGVATDDAFDEEERNRALEMAEKTLIRMASGGIYDHLGGGFHRYSVDGRWLVPHFEKMLYDNALLMRAYVEAFQLTKRPFYRRVITEIADYVLAEMVDADEGTGAFFSTQDADSEGEEGKFFVWTPEELKEVLGTEQGQKAAGYWGVSDEGNFEEGTSVLHRLHHLDARGDELPSDRLDDEVLQWRQQLLKARKHRVRPARDEKIIASWNGMMIEALAAAGRALNRDDYIEAARTAADFVLDEMCSDDRAQGLCRIHKDGRTRFAASLDDVANMAVATVQLFEATGEPSWLDDARRLVEEMVERFERPQGGFFYAAKDHRDLLVRQTEVHDGATPSATARALEALYRLDAWTDKDSLEKRLAEGLRAFYPSMERQPAAMTHMVAVLDAYMSGPLEVVLVRGSEQDEQSQRLEKTIRQAYLRHGSSVILEAGQVDKGPMVVAGKSAVDSKSAAYVCQRGRCASPVTEVDDLLEDLESWVGNSQ